MAEQSGKRRRWVKWLVGAAALLLVLVGLAPTIAGWFAPGIASGAIGGAINGSATVESVSLSWFGGQRVGPVIIKDSAGRTVANVTVTASRGLLGLARAGTAGGDVGEVTVTGAAHVVRGKDGTLNVATLAKGGGTSSTAGSSKGGGGDAKLPDGLKGSVVLDKLALEFTDESAGARVAKISVPALSGRASLEGGNAAVNLSGELQYQRTLADQPVSGGSVLVKAGATGLTDAAGTLTPAAASLDVSAELKDVAVALADAVAGTEQKLVAAIGDTLRASVVVKGTMRDAEGTVAVVSRGVNADLALKTAGGVLTASKPGTISVLGAGLMPLVPGLDEGLKASGMTLSGLPDVRARVESLRLPLPMDGKPLDLRGGSVALAVETSEVTGTVRVPGSDGAPGTSRAMRIAPLKALIAGEDLAKKVAVTGGTEATIDGKRAGVLAVDVAAFELLDGNGAPGMPGRVEGGLKLTELATALAQPLAAASKIDLARDVGPTLDVEVRAATGEPSGGAPTMNVTLDVRSANVVAASRAVVSGKVVHLPGMDTKVRVASAGPMIGRMLGAGPVSIESGLPVAMELQNVTLDLEKYGNTKDLRAFKGLLKVETGSGAGTLALAGQKAQALEIAPFVATVDARDIAAGVKLIAAGSMKLDGVQAAVLAADVTASELMKADGTAAGGMPALRGQVQLSEVATAIAQPMVETLGLNLPAGVGPKLAVNATLAAAAGGGAGAIPTTDVDVEVKSAGVNGSIAMTLAGRTLKTRGGEHAFSLRSPATLAGKAARDAGVAMSEGGYAKVTVRSLAVEMDEAWRPRMERVAADAEVNVGGFSVSPATESGAAPVYLNQMIVGAKLAAGATPAVTVKGSGKQGEGSFFLQGAMDLVGLIGKDGAITPAAVKPIGTLDLNNVPTTLVGLVVAPTKPAQPGQAPPLDVARLVREAVGPAVTVKVASAATGAAGSDGRTVSMTVASARVNGGLEGTLDSTAAALSKLEFRTQVSPELAGALIDSFGSGLASKPRLVSPAAVVISATPVRVPLKNGSPELSQAGELALRIAVDGRAMIDNVMVKGEGSEVRDLGGIGLENTLITASVPLASLAKGGAAKPAQARVTAAVLGKGGAKIMDLATGARVNLADGGPSGDLNADLKLALADASWVDTFLGSPGLLAGGIGETATIEGAAVVSFPKNGSAGGAAYERAVITASVKSPRLSTVQPLKATAVPGKAGIDSPLVLDWEMEPGWGNRYVMAPSKKGLEPVAQFTAPTNVKVSVYRLAVNTGKGGPMKQGVFTADVGVESPGTTLRLGRGEGAAPAPLTNLKARLTGGKEPGTLGFSLTLDDAGGGMVDGKPAVSFAGGVYGVADGAGVLTTDAAKITASGTAKKIRTAIVDAVGRQNGVVEEALGPTADLEIKAQGLSKEAGKLDIVAISPRAESRISGVIDGGAFRIAQPAQGKPAQLVTIKEATSKLGGMLVKGLPVVGSFEKKPEDGPATINAYNLVVPIDGDMSKLNGNIVVDMGSARFATSAAFKTILKLARQQEAGMIGQRLQPFEIVFKDGVGTYDKVMLPLGEFRLGTGGSFDLVNRQIDVVTYIPLGAITDEAAGLFNTGAGKLIGGAIPLVEQATMMPFRTSGSFDNPRTRPDAELFAKEFIGTIRPDKIIKDIFK